jgi:enoyl-CoA hydratase
MNYETLEVQRRGRVAVVTLVRTEALNALNMRLMDELTHAVDALEADAGIGCLVLTGSGRAFAAGADIKEMAFKTYPEAYGEDFITRNWERLTRTRKPVIAAVNGLALGGGCELAMMCDFILASDDARFAQPEIKVGVMPGAGGTQRLARFIGKSKAMEMCLTGRMMDAEEAERCGLVAKVVPADRLLEEALKVAETIAAMPPLAAVAVKEMINAAFEMPLSQGIRFERRLFHGLFGTEDQKEGMTAFVDKRPGNWTGR